MVILYESSSSGGRLSGDLDSIFDVLGVMVGSWQERIGTESGVKPTNTSSLKSAIDLHLLRKRMQPQICEPLEDNGKELKAFGLEKMALT
jgi:hypothetical protein